ncbi:MAG: histidinol-phosphate aminotransferase family protein [Spirochaetaceae bacterium]|nr:histidinol-phosphate aminotransferase family protein [Spirochaetaceae bacterium]
MKKIEDFFVPWLKGIPMYISPHIELAWKDSSLHRMMSNENPLPPAKSVLEAIEKYAKMGNFYADQGLICRNKIAELNGLADADNVLIGNGSSEVYDMVWRSFIAAGAGEEVIQHTPCFGIYKLRCEVNGGKLVSVPMKLENKKFVFDPDGIIKAITPKTKIIVVANPNNPTANFMPEEGFRKIAQTGIPFVVDEAYIEFAGYGKSMVKLIKEFPNVMITRTMSKAYGLAGLRFGYLLAAKEVIKQISGTLIPWNVSTITLWACYAAFNDQAALKERVDFNNQQVKWISDELSKIPGLTVFESYGNYMLFDGTDAGIVGKELVDYILKTKKLILRNQEDIYGRNGWFRITISIKEDNKNFVEGVKEYVAKIKK